MLPESISELHRFRALVAPPPGSGGKYCEIMHVLIAVDALQDSFLCSVDSGLLPVNFIIAISWAIFLFCRSNPDILTE